MRGLLDCLLRLTCLDLIDGKTRILLGLLLVAWILELMSTNH